MISLATLEDWHLQALDVKTAFLYGTLDEEIYMKQPEGFKVKGKEHLVLRLKRAIYGLKQASFSWWKSMTTSMEKMGFKRTYADAGVFMFQQGNDKVIAVVYVDDAIFMGPNLPLVMKKKQEFMKKWECRDLGEAKEFLSMRITRVNGRIELDQEKYLMDVLKRFGQENASIAPTPLPMGTKLLPNEEPVDPKIRSRFQSVIGSLLYLMIGTRPDIAYAVISLSKFTANPSELHLKKALYICKYLVSTKHYRLVYDGKAQKGLCAYTDSDWGGEITTSHSMTGNLIKMAGGAVSWSS